MRKKRKRARARQGQEAGPPAPAVTTTMGDLLTRAGLSRAKKAKKAASGPAASPVAEPASAAGPDTETESGSVAEPAPASEAGSAAASDTEPESRSEQFRPLSAGDLAAWNRAYAGVRPLGGARQGPVRKGGRRAGRVAPRRPALEGASEQAARARLGALVAAGVRFTVERDDGYVRGLREGASEGLWRRLSGRGFSPEAILDLHGMRAAQAERAVHDFVRERHKRGVRYLLLIPGKGAHSEGGVGVLGEVVVRVLTQGGAAPLVQAFTTAHPVHGGRGALAVLLR